MYKIFYSLKITIFAIFVMFASFLTHADTPLATNDQIGKYFQDLKNFMALQDLTKTKGKIMHALEDPEGAQTTVSNGYKANKLRTFINNMNPVLDMDLVKYNLYMPSSVGNDESFVNDHLNNYCNVMEADYKLCSSSNPLAAPYDLMGSSLLEKNVFADQSSQAMAFNYVRNLINPVPAPMPDNLITSPNRISDKGYSILAQKYKATPALTLAQYIIQNMYTDRLSLSGAAGGKSILSVLEEESSRRFTDPKWYQGLSSKSQETLLREIAHMLSLQLMMDFRNNRYLERISAVLAATLAQSMNLLGQVQDAQQKGENAIQNIPGLN